MKNLFKINTKQRWLQSSLNNFESSLIERLKKLKPKNKDEILTLSWLIIAMETLCDTHNDLNIFINNLNLHDITNIENNYWVDVYIDITLKVLDLCNAFSSKLNHIKHCIFGFKCLMHNQELKSKEQRSKICSTLDTNWRQNIIVTTSQIEKILEVFVESLTYPKVKNFRKAKNICLCKLKRVENRDEVEVFLKAFYAVNVLTVYISSVFATFLSNSDKGFMHIPISKESLWGKSFLDLQSVVNGEIRDALLSLDGKMILKELESIDAKVKKMYLTIQDGDDLVQESFKNFMVELKEEVENLGDGLNVLSGKIHNLFSVTLKGRNTIGLMTI